MICNTIWISIARMRTTYKMGAKVARKECLLATAFTVSLTRRSLSAAVST
jgi:hypothetical protein